MNQTETRVTPGCWGEGGHNFKTYIFVVHKHSKHSTSATNTAANLNQACTILAPLSGPCSVLKSRVQISKHVLNRLFQFRRHHLLPCGRFLLRRWWSQCTCSYEDIIQKCSHRENIKPSTCIPKKNNNYFFQRNEWAKLKYFTGIWCERGRRRKCALHENSTLWYDIIIVSGGAVLGCPRRPRARIHHRLLWNKRGFSLLIDWTYSLIGLFSSQLQRLADAWALAATSLHASTANIRCCIIFTPQI